MFDDLIRFVANDLRDSELLAATHVLASYEKLNGAERTKLLAVLTQELERREQQPRPNPPFELSAGL